MNWFNNFYTRVIPDSWKRQKKFLEFHDALTEYFDETYVFLYPGTKWGPKEESLFMDSFAMWSIPKYDLIISVGNDIHVDLTKNNDKLTWLNFENFENFESILDEISKKIR